MRELSNTTRAIATSSYVAGNDTPAKLQPSTGRSGHLRTLRASATQSRCKRFFLRSKIARGAAMTDEQKTSTPADEAPLIDGEGLVDTEYKVGPGHPPKEHQWKPG